MAVKNTYEFKININADEDWKPLATACWVYCPFSALTRLGETCRAYDAYEENKLIICPLAKYGIKKI